MTEMNVSAQQRATRLERRLRGRSRKRCRRNGSRCTAGAGACASGRCTRGGKDDFARSVAACLSLSPSYPVHQISFPPMWWVSASFEDSGKFEFIRGPLFANLVLADEINRTTLRTQSALLEAMNENQITVDNNTHPLETPFVVLLYKTPEFAGTIHYLNLK